MSATTIHVTEALAAAFARLSAQLAHPEFEGPVEAQLMLCRQGKVGDGYVSHFTSIDEVTDEMVDRFKKAWHEADESGLDGSRVRAGLQAVFEVVILDAESVPE